MQFFAVFSRKLETKDGHEYEPESLAVVQCSLDRHLKNCGRNYSILRDGEFANSRQQLEVKRRKLRAKGYGKRKNASRALISEADEEFLWSSANILEINHNILVCFSL